MINLCGRYVAYSTPILAICCLRIGEFSKVINRKCIIRRLLSGIIIGWSGVWLPYFLLYVFSPGVEQSTSWLTGIRAAENAGFTNFRIELCLIYSICILFILVVDYRISIGIICVLMCVNSFAAILTCEKYHSKDFEYSKMMKELFSEYQNDTIAVLCTNSADYENLYGKWLFYQVGHKYDKISILSLAGIEKPLYFDGENYDYLFALNEGTGEEQGGLRLQKWNREEFENNETEIDVYLQKENDKVQIHCVGYENIILVSGMYILPTEIENQEIFCTVDLSMVEDNVVYLYDLSKLTVSEIFVE